MRRLLNLCIIGLIGLIFVTNAALAVDPPSKTEGIIFSEATNKALGTFPKPPDNYTPGDTITTILKDILFPFLGILAVSFVIYAGYLWMTSGGEAEKAKKARTLLIDATIGAAIIMAAWGLVYVISVALINIAKP